MPDAAVPGGPTPVLQGRLDGAVPGSGEAFHGLARIGAARIEHIVSSAHPDHDEQVQDGDEWVLLLTGAAALELPEGRLDLAPGQWLVIPAGVPHRVLRTDAGTQWLAVHGPVAPGDRAGEG